MPLTIDSRVEDGLAILELSGSLTLGPQLSNLRRTAREVLENHPISGLILDVSGVTATDTSGLGELIGTYSYAARRNCPILLVGVSGTLRRILEITRLDELLPTAPDLASAKNQMRKS